MTKLHYFYARILKKKRGAATAISNNLVTKLYKIIENFGELLF